MHRECGSTGGIAFACALMVLAARPAGAGVMYVGVAAGAGGEVEQVLPDGSVKPFASGLSTPNGLAFDAAGNLYEADDGQHVINRITPDGHVSTFVPFGKFVTPQGITFDASGNLFVADPGTGLSEVAPDGTVTLIATRSQTFQPFGLAYHGGNFFAASQDGTIRQITPGGTVSTYATGLSGVLWGVAFDANDDLFVADAKGVERVAPDGTVSSFATSLAQQMPIGLAFDGGNLYAACYLSSEIKQITPAGSVSTFATLPGHPRYLVDAVPEPTGACTVLACTAGLIARRARREETRRGVSNVELSARDGEVASASKPADSLANVAKRNDPAPSGTGSSLQAGEGGRTLDIHVGNVTLYH